MTLPKPNQIDAFTVTLLENDDAYLLIQRSPDKHFAPNLFTGIGGRVEQTEYSDLRASALRELYEESGIREDEVEGYKLRRVMLHNRPGGPLTLLLYYTGRISRRITPESPEGILSWRTAEEFDQLAVIETTRPVLRLLVEDMARDPDGHEPIQMGIAIYEHPGVFRGVVWADLFMKSR